MLKPGDVGVYWGWPVAVKAVADTEATIAVDDDGFNVFGGETTRRVAVADLMVTTADVTTPRRPVPASDLVGVALAQEEHMTAAIRAMASTSEKACASLALVPSGTEPRFLAALPPSIAQLSAGLRELNLAGNVLTDLPREVSALVNLVYFRLSFNRFTVVPAALGALPSLVHLLLDNNLITHVHPALVGATALQSLDLSANLVVYVPPELQALKSVVSLFLQGNKIKLLPAELGRLGSVVELDIGSNPLEQLPSFLTALPLLESLSMSGIGVDASQLDWLQHATALRELDLSHNNRLARLPRLPKTLCVLRASNCALSSGWELVDAVAELHDLESLDVSDNQIAVFDDAMDSRLPPLLDELDLSGNPCVQVAPGPAAVQIPALDLSALSPARAAAATTGDELSVVETSSEEIGELRAELARLRSALDSASAPSLSMQVSREVDSIGAPAAATINPAASAVNISMLPPVPGTPSTDAVLGDRPSPLVNNAPTALQHDGAKTVEAPPTTFLETAVAPVPATAVATPVVPAPPPAPPIQPPPPPPASPALTRAKSSVVGKARPKWLQDMMPADDDSDDEQKKKKKDAPLEVPPYFKDAGTIVGLEVWRIESMVPVKLRVEDIGIFYTGDSYIVNSTKEEGGKNVHAVHFWVGAQSTRDEYTTACFAAGTLAQLMDCHQAVREDQGEESKAFNGYFWFGKVIKEGGVAPAEHHVASVKANMLYRLKGVKHVRLERVETSWRSLNSGEVYVLDCVKMLYRWNGAQASMKEHGAALDFSTRMKAERGGKLVTQIIDEADQDNTQWEEFWRLLGSTTGARPGPIASDSSSMTDVAYEAQWESATKLYRLQENNLNVNAIMITERPIRKKFLISQDSFIIDTPSDVFTWVGRDSSAEEKNASFKCAQMLFESRPRSQWSAITRVVEGAETHMFKHYFVDWKDPPAKATQPQTQAVVVKTRVAASTKRGIPDVALMRQHAALPDTSPTLPTNGQISRIVVFESDRHIFTLSPRLAGNFFSGDSLVIIYSYVEKEGGLTKKCSLIYFWSGTNADPRAFVAYEMSMGASLKSKFAAAGMVVPVVRVSQHREPKHFLSLFEDCFILHDGHAREYIPVRAGLVVDPKRTHKELIGMEPKQIWNANDWRMDKPTLYRVRARANVVGVAMQVPPTASSLNSADAFILHRPASEHCIIWLGTGCSPSTAPHIRDTASAIHTLRRSCNALASPLPRKPVTSDEDEEEEEEDSEDPDTDGIVDATTMVREGQEPPEFWDALGGKTEYCREAYLRNGGRNVYFFVFSLEGSLKPQPVADFCQGDLEADAAIMLDAGARVFIWTGAHVNALKRQLATATAEAYAAGMTPPAEVVIVDAGSEPQDFACHFPMWKATEQKVWVDPREAMVKQREKAEAARMRDVSRAVKENKCTITVTRDHSEQSLQTFYVCMDHQITLCLSCAAACHQGHKLGERIRTAGHCQCSQNASGIPCKCQ